VASSRGRVLISALAIGPMAAQASLARTAMK
jgi:hypothetical protein